ncbi:DMT family transporter [Paenibacillus sp. SAF-054]|uniref:DMT family transporter n=1 Tax=Paenibacillus sp. SAF-054 TaxID=3436863 RepID=UPI003F7E794A
MACTLFTMLVAGLNFPIGKIALAFGSPFVLLAIRFIGAGLLMLPFILRRPHPRQAADWLKIAVIGLFQSGLVMAGIYLSMETITSGSSSILSSTNPIWFIVFSFLLFGVRYRIIQWLGVLVGFAGVAMTQGFKVQMEAGFWYALGAGIAWGLATLLTSRWGKLYDSWVMAAYQMLIGGVILLAASPLLEQPEFRLDPSELGKELFVIGWMILMSSIAQFVTWYYVLQNSDPGKANVYLFLIPLFGLLSGWLILGERLHTYVLAGAACIGLGIIFVNWPGRRPTDDVNIEGADSNVPANTGGTSAR